LIGYNSDFQKVFWSLLEVYQFALEVWKTKEAAKDFLTRPHPELKMKTPIYRAIESNKGREEVMSILGKLQHGSAV
jgi:putative toxin-antitoxin system antitoxin component (TIGR02293 family)